MDKILSMLMVCLARSIIGYISVGIRTTGVSSGGYIFSFGIARATRDLVEEFLYPVQKAKL